MRWDRRPFACRLRSELLRPRRLRPRQPPRYDSGLTAAKIAITLPREQLAKVQRAVTSGEASSVSGYIALALAEKEQRESLRALVDDLKAEHGAPNKREVAWAKRALSRSRHK